MSEEQKFTLEDARRMLAADYWADVRRVAEDVQRAITDGEITDREDFQTWLHETVDGHSRVIYTYEAQECLLFSENSGAFEEFGADFVVEHGEINWSRMAYCAFHADIVRHLDVLGVDVNDPIPEPEEDEKEEQKLMEE